MGAVKDGFKGNAKKLEGDLTGEKRKQAEGEAQRALGDAEQRAKDLGNEAKNVNEQV